MSSRLLASALKRPEMSEALMTRRRGLRGQRQKAKGRQKAEEVVEAVGPRARPQ